MKRFALIDNYKTEGITGEHRFSIKQIDYWHTDILTKEVICIDKYAGNLEISKELLLDSWERRSKPIAKDLPVSRHNLCVTGHSSDAYQLVKVGKTRQPWWQVKEQVVKRGFEFYG